MHIVLIVALILGNYLIELGAKEEKKRKIKLIYFGIVLFLFAALRSPFVGTDAERYFYSFLRIKDMNMTEVLASGYRDIGYFVFTKVVSIIFVTPQLYFAFISFIVVWCFLYFVNDTREDVFVCVVLFVGLRVFAFCLTAFRQAIAMSLIWVAMVQLRKKKLIPFIILTLLAGFIHASAWIFFVAGLAYIPDKKRKFTIPVMIVAIVDAVSRGMLSGFITNTVFNGRFTEYLEISAGEVSVSSTFVVYLLMFIIIFAVYNRFKNENSDYFYFMMLCAMAFEIMGRTNGMMFRMAYFFIVGFYPLFCRAVETIVTRNSLPATKLIIALLVGGQYLILGSGAGTEIYTFFWQV